MKLKDLDPSDIFELRDRLNRLKILNHKLRVDFVEVGERVLILDGLRRNNLEEEGN